MSIEELRKKFTEIVSLITTAENDTEERTMLGEALEIVDEKEFKENVDGVAIRTTIGGIEREMTVLEYVEYFNSQGYYSDSPRRNLKNKTLNKLETAIADVKEARLQELLQRINDFKSKNQKSVCRDIVEAVKVMGSMTAALVLPMGIAVFYQFNREQLEELLPMSGMLATTVAVAVTEVFIKLSQACIGNPLEEVTSIESHRRPEHNR